MSSLVRFGLYFIPEQGPLYKTGSKLLGYDIRAEKNIKPYDFVRPEWTTMAAPYGFHATITDTLTIEADKLPGVITAVQSLVACLDIDNRYMLTNGGIQRWQDEYFVLELLPNRNVELLHDILVACIHPMGIGSAYTDAYKQGTRRYDPDSPEAARIQLFHSPYIFDAFRPHFTCLSPFAGTDAEGRKLEHQLKELFADTVHVTMNRLALVVQNEGESHFRIHTEFNLH